MLQGLAGEFVYDQLPKSTRRTYKLLVQELGSRFHVIESCKTYGAQFSHHDQRTGESAEEYVAELKRLYDKAHGGRDRKTRIEDLLRRFLDGLLDDWASFQVEYIKAPEDIDEAALALVDFQETWRRSKLMTERWEGGSQNGPLPRWWLIQCWWWWRWPYKGRRQDCSTGSPDEGQDTGTTVACVKQRRWQRGKWPYQSLQEYPRPHGPDATAVHLD